MGKCLLCIYGIVVVRDYRGIGILQYCDKEVICWLLVFGKFFMKDRMDLVNFVIKLGINIFLV